VGRQAGQPSVCCLSQHRGHDHDLGWKNTARQPHRRHRQERTPEHAMGARLRGLTRLGLQIPDQQRSIPRWIRCRPTTNSSGPRAH
jgi:hypothetical protein